MLGFFRGFLNTWPSRIFFLVLAAAFALWGVSGKNPFGADDSAAATVSGHKISLVELQQAYQQELAQVSRMLGGKTDLSLAQRQQVAEQALERLLTQAALQAKADQMGVAVPDAALRQAAFSIPAFRDAAGNYDRGKMLQALQANGLTEQRFVELLRHDLAQAQMLEAVRAGAQAPETLVRQVYVFQHETRTADAVDLPFATVPPSTPTDAQVQRWYENNLGRYSHPEYRKIKLVVLSPESVGKGIPVTDDELRAAYEQHKGEYTTLAKRSVQVLTLTDEAAASRLAAQWSTGADWAAMQQAAQAGGGSAVELPDASRDEFPAPELAEAAFATNADTVAPPVHGAAGWYVVKVIKVVEGGAKTFEQARDQLRAQVQAEKASDLIDTRAHTIDEKLAGGTSLDDLPGDLGLEAATGTLDAQGRTQTGEPAPIPGPLELRPALLAAAFQAKKGDVPKLVQTPAAAGGGQSYYAFSVEDIIPAGPKPLAEVHDGVRADVIHDDARHTQDAAAAKLLTAIQGGESLDDAAKGAGLAVRHLPATGRASPTDGVPANLVQPLFTLARGQPTMVETPDGFMVAVLTGIVTPDLKADPIGATQIRDALTRALGDDAESVFATAVRSAARPTVNRAMFGSLTASNAGE